MTFQFLKYLIPIAVISTPVAAFAGPFGLEMGMMQGDLSIELTELNPAAHPTHSSNTAPLPNKMFDRYLYKFGESGLCSVRGVGSFALSDDTLGAGVSSQTNKVIDLLKVKYGDPVEINKYPISNVEPLGLMWNIRENHMHYSVEWKSVGDKSLPSNIQSIYLSSSAKTQTSATISIDYSFTNYSGCSGELNSSGL